MIKREHYIASIRPFYDSDLVKIITGIRRSGKSVLLEQIMGEIRLAGHETQYLNFEDMGVMDRIPDGKELLLYVGCDQRKERLYLFLDEVQNLPGWVDAVKSLRLQQVSVFITGSNSKLLSREFTQYLSGRYVAFQVRPFVYRELREYAGELGRDVSITDYLVWGGFPKRLEFTGEAQIQYLRDIDATIVLNDLISRYKIRKVALFRSLINFVLRSNARIFSAKSVFDYLKGKENKCSINTIIKYVGYLQEAYIVDLVPLYSRKAKQELVLKAKLYIMDVAFNSLRCFGKHFDLTHNLENIVYNELIYAGYEIQVYNDGQQEIDFVAVKNGKTCYIQVAYSVAEESTYQRELRPFQKLDNLNRKILITCDEIDYSTSCVEHIKLQDFLLKGL